VGRVLPHVVRWAVILAMPAFLVLTAARLLVADWYPRYEYAKPDFPPDRYGMSQTQRLELALVAIAFLNDPRSPEDSIIMLEEQRLPGSNQPLYSTPELDHMIDVKRVMTMLWSVQAVAAAVVIIGLALLIARRSTRLMGYNALYGAGLFTAVLLVGLALFVLLAWNTFFVQFHQIFFTPGTWTFDWSDSLIRLFPEKFWFDAGVIIAVASLVAAVVIAATGYALARWWAQQTNPGESLTVAGGMR
jgi:integral membrane protein (TIGR01906 family)